MNKFEKVSVEEYSKSIGDTSLTKEQIQKEYDEIKLPERKTKNSAGYDFFVPYKTIIEPGESVVIPTGIKCKIDEKSFLSLFPRSSLGFKYRLQLDNTVGIIDADYYNNDSNEGHIFAKITNNSNVSGRGVMLTLEQGEAFMQGVFLKYGVTEDDYVTKERTGGIGSTND